VETVLQFVQLIALLSLTALSIYLIVILSGLRRDVSEFVQRAKPVLENLAFITEKLKSTAQKIDDHVDIVKSSLNSLKNVADNVLVLEERVQQRLEEPILQVASIIGAIVSSVGVFFDRFRPRG
jgi:Mg2+ and Co2+ transporter CorA